MGKSDMKKFLTKLSYTVLPLWLATMGLVAYFHLAVEPNIHGELGSLGKMPFAPEVMNDTIAHKYYTDIEDERLLADTVVDVLTIGDSFSQQGLGSYENFLARDGLRVANFHMNQNMFQTAYDMMNLGFVDSTHVKAIVVECVERYLVERATSLKMGNDAIAKSRIGRANAMGGDNGGDSGASRVNWSLLEAKNYLMLRLGHPEPVKHCTLNRQLFNGPRGKELYFYYEDLNRFHIGKEEQAVIAHNIALLNHKADSLGIAILYLVPPDKLDLYQDFIVDNPYPRKTVNEDLSRCFPTPERLLPGKDVLLPLVKSGEKDVYHLSSTHWSYASARRIAAAVARRLHLAPSCK